MTMHILCVIPARIGSSRLHHKPLQTIADQPLIRLVAQRALDFRFLDHVVVATDDRRVADAVAGLDVEAVLTSRRHRNGTERTAAVAKLPRFAAAKIVVNLQGDEPFVSAESVAGAIAEVRQGASVGTGGARLDPAKLLDPGTVKVFVDSSGRALAFSRGARPTTPDVRETAVLHHVGVYAYRPAALSRWASVDPVEEEIAQSLEQLRPLSYGEHIGVCKLDAAAPRGIDTVADLHEARELVSAIN